MQYEKEDAQVYRLGCLFGGSRCWVVEQNCEVKPMHIHQDLYGFRCNCGEHDRRNFYSYETESKIKCLTCGVEYIKNRRGQFEIKELSKGGSK